MRKYYIIINICEDSVTTLPKRRVDKKLVADAASLHFGGATK